MFWFYYWLKEKKKRQNEKKGEEGLVKGKGNLEKKGKEIKEKNRFFFVDLCIIVVSRDNLLQIKEGIKLFLYFYRVEYYKVGKMIQRLFQ